MRYAITALITALCFLPLRAQADTLSVSDLLQIGQGLAALDHGYETTAKDGAQEHVVKQTFAFSPGVLMALVKDEIAISTALKAFDVTRTKLVQDAADGGDPAKLDAKTTATLTAKLQPLLDEKHDVALVHFKTADFNLDKNPIPLAALVALAPLIDDK